MYYLKIMVAFLFVGWLISIFCTEDINRLDKLEEKIKILENTIIYQLSNKGE